MSESKEIVIPSIVIPEEADTVTPDAADTAKEPKIKKRKRHTKEQVLDEDDLMCAGVQPLHYHLMPCWGCNSVLIDDHEAVKKAKKKRTRASTAESSRPIDLWRQVTHEVTQSNRVITKSSPFYEECKRVYKEKFGAKPKQDALSAAISAITGEDKAVKQEQSSS